MQGQPPRSHPLAPLFVLSPSLRSLFLSLSLSFTSLLVQLLLSAVSEQARKEWSIEKNLKAMRELWTHVSYSTSAYKETGTHVLQGACVEEIQLLLVSDATLDF